MAENPEVGCVRPSGGPVDEAEETQKSHTAEIPKERRQMVQVGKAAPDFTAPAYLKGKFTQVKLSDYLGKWVVLCMYPGDFTFV